MVDDPSISNEVLHSNFPVEKQVNPTKFDHLLIEWRAVLNHYFSQHHRKLIFSCQQLHGDLSYPGLYTALNDFIGRQVMIYDYQLPYFCETFWKYLKFILCKPFAAHERIDYMDGQLIHLQHLQEIANKIRQLPNHDRSSKIYLLQDFKKVLAQYTDDIDFLFDYLVLNQIIHQQKNVVKFGPDAIQPTDTQILTVKTAIISITRYCNSMEEAIQTTHQDILKNKANKPKALMLLKKKKLLEHAFQQKLVSLETLENILMKIDTCETDKQIMDAYQHGAQVIQTTLKAYELTPEKISETMDLVESTLDMAKEIEEALPSVQIDDELEREYEQLQQPQKEFPSAPVQQPVQETPVQHYYAQ